MMTFEIDNSNEGIEVYLDKTGIEELIGYLNFIKDNNDHYHLLVGNELDDTTVNKNNTLVKHVKLIYLE